MKYEKGLFYKNFFIDALRKQKKGIGFISHAHSDHARKHDAQIFVSPATRKLLGYGQIFTEGEMDGVYVRFLPSNHILGSVQIFIQDGMSLLYSGDIRMQESMYGKPKIVEADILIVESTYGKPGIRFPNYDDFLSEFEGWVMQCLGKGKKVVIWANVLGKAQEIIWALNKMGISPIVHPKIKTVCNVYRDFGYNLTYSKEGDVFVMPQSMMSKPIIKALKKQGYEMAIVTGWAALYKYPFKAFPFSDHADFNGLLQYVEAVNPNKVYVVHGFKQEFARELRKRGWDAEPL